MAAAVLKRRRCLVGANKQTPPVNRLTALLMLQSWNRPLCLPSTGNWMLLFASSIQILRIQTVSETDKGRERSERERLTICFPP